MAKTVFEVNGKQFPTMVAVAKELGRSRVYRTDFERFGINEIDESEVREIETSEVTEELANEPEVNEPEVKQNSEHLTQSELSELRGELNMETIYAWASGVKHMTSGEIREVLVKQLGYNDDSVPSVLNKGTRMHLVRMFRESLYPGEERPKVGAKAFRHLNLTDLKALYTEAGYDEDDITGDTDKGQRRYILKVFRENGIHHPEEVK